MEIQKILKNRQDFKKLEKQLLPFLGKQINAICGNFKGATLMTVDINEYSDYESAELIIKNFET